MVPSIGKLVIAGRTGWKRNSKWNIMSRLNRARKNCRIFSIASIAIAYIFAYSFLSSNSDFIGFYDEVSYASQSNNKQTYTVSQFDLHISEIRRKATRMARVYKPSHPSTWCVDSRLKFDQKPHQPMGLCYLRIPHSAGGTLKGINMRISRNFAQRHDIESCIRHDAISKGMDYTRRDKQSYLWTFLRDPTHRAMSVIGSSLSNHLHRSNNATVVEKEASNRNIIVNRTLDMLQHSTDIRNGVLSEGRGGFQLQFGMQIYIPVNDVNDPTNVTKIVNLSRLAGHVSNIIERYDFVGLVERFDESLVVMQLLLGLESSDILYFAVHRKEQWHRAKKGNKKQECRKSLDWEVDLLTEPPIRDYLLESKEWYAQNYGDYLLYQAAAQSLDQTIMAIGLDVFSQELKKFQTLMTRAKEECFPVFPCSLNGTKQFDEAQYDCLDEGKIGCGYRCLDGLTA